MIPGDLLSTCPHRQFHTLPSLLDSRAALSNSYPNACVPMQGGSLYHFYDGLWYDPAEIRWPVTYRGASSITDNGNTDLKCVYRFCRNRSVRGAIRILLFLYRGFMKMKYFPSKFIHAYNLVPVRILEKHWHLKIENFHKNEFPYPTLWTNYYYLTVCLTINCQIILRFNQFTNQMSLCFREICLWHYGHLINRIRVNPFQLHSTKNETAMELQLY